MEFIYPIIVKSVGGWHIEEIFTDELEINITHYHYCSLIIGFKRPVVAAPPIDNVIAGMVEPARPVVMV